jgi:3',5'-cyclic-AMP phosphodiesterase
MTKLIVFTDLHMVPEGKTIIGLDPYKRLETGIAHVNAWHADADGVIVTGDLTHHGDVVSYTRLKELLDQLTPPLYPAVGNHDNRKNFLSVFTETATDENGFVQRALDFADCRALIVDSLFAPPYEYPISHAGFLCDKRLAWLDHQLASAKADDKPVLIFMHHPPHKTGFSGMDVIKLINEDAFYELAHKHGNVRHIFAGHVHRTINGSHRGIPYSILKSPVHQQPMPFDMPDASLSVDEPAAYGIVVTTEHGLQYHNEDYEIAQREPLKASH